MVVLVVGNICKFLWKITYIRAPFFGTNKAISRISDIVFAVAKIILINHSVKNSTYKWDII